MITKKIALSIGSSVAGAALLMGLAVVPAYAQTVSATVAVGATTTVGAKVGDRLAAIIDRSNTEITARVAALNALAARIGSMINVSASEKASIMSEVQTNTSGLTALNATIDADTSTTTAIANEKSIFGTFRIYALVIPQGYIEAAANRVGVIQGLMNTLSAKFQTRISADQSAGDNVTALQADLSDFNTQVTNAEAQAQIAQSGVVSLTPDQGNQTIFNSNHAALVSARANIKTATSDLQAARKIATTILQGLKSFEVSATTTATTTVN